MPEGDAVWRTAQQLHAALAGQPITEWELRWGTLGASDKRGRTTLEVVPRGKHILHRLDDGSTLHSHLRMDGNWRVLATGQVTRGQRHDHRLRALIATDSTVALGRLLGMLDLVPTRDEASLVGHLGPDLLGADWDAERAVDRIGAQPQRVLGDALLDQRNLAGLGTMWVAETCWLERVSPWTPIADLPSGALEAVVERAHTVLRGTLGHPRSVATGNWRDPMHIYGKVGRPCPRCGIRLRQDPIGTGPTQRVLVHCPACQPGLG